jgi:TPR repeat protein
LVREFSLEVPLSTIDDAFRAYQSKDFLTARRICTDLADAGDAQARYLLGRMTSLGEGREPDPAAAASLYRLAAEAGHAGAQHSLAAMSALGRGVNQDFAEAMRWYCAAADSGDTDALFKVGIMYAHGEGVAVDLAESRRWWQRAAEAGHAGAMRCLGELHATGAGGVAKDVVTAAESYLRAHRAGDEHAFGLLLRLESDLQAAADAGSAVAQNALGIALQFDRKDSKAAAERFEQAAAQDHPESLRLLGVLCVTGQGVAKEEARGIALYRRAAELGDAYAQQNLGAAYDAAMGGLQRDVSAAIKWYRRAANQGLGKVNRRLAELLAERNRDRRDANEAVQRLSLAAMSGPADAEYHVAAGDGSWSVSMKERGTITALRGLNMDELQGLPDED